MLIEALSKTSGFKVATRDPDSSPATGPDLLVALISGLKNWEQGMTAAALPHFQAVLAAGAKGGDAWIVPYQEILRGLAFKWQRILFRCWKNKELYDEERYLQRLRATGSNLVPFLSPDPVEST